MEETTVNHTELLHTLATSNRSFVTEDNMAEFTFERTYANPIDKRPIHVFTHTNGSSVHLENDGQLYTSFGPTTEETVQETPRERGELTEGMQQLIKLRAGDTGTVSALDGQPRQAPVTMEPRDDDTTVPAVMVENDVDDVESLDQTK